MTVLLYENWSRCLHSDLMIPCISAERCLPWNNIGQWSSVCWVYCQALLWKWIFCLFFMWLDILVCALTAAGLQCSLVFGVEMKAWQWCYILCLSFCCYIICVQSQGSLNYSGTAVPRQDVTCGTCNILLVDIRVISRALSTLFKCLKLACCYLI
jgi:hypothetical protein